VEEYFQPAIFMEECLSPVAITLQRFLSLRRKQNNFFQVKQQGLDLLVETCRKGEVESCNAVGGWYLTPGEVSCLFLPHYFS
jgi:hypothetical protein